MPNLRKMEQINGRIEEIDKVLRRAKNFLDNKAYFETEKGRELMTIPQLEVLRAAEVEKLQLAGQEL